MRRVTTVFFGLLAFGCGGGGDPSDPDASASGGADASESCAVEPGWITGPALARGPTQETATVAVAGKIYVLGGFRGFTVLSDVQVFDTATCAWTDGPALPRPLHHINAAVLDDTIYIVGALEGGTFTATGSVWSWAPATETGWTERAAMPAGSERGAAIAGAIDDRIYVAGGFRGGAAVADVSSFDPGTGVWDTTLPALPEARDHACGGVVDGALYVAGGRLGSINSIRDTLFEYTPDGDWQSRAPMPTARGGTACGVIGGRLLVAGGEGNPNDPSGVFPELEAYTAADDAWESLAPMPVPRHGMGAAASGGSLYVPGGADTDGFGAVATHEIFTP